jgi:hypothetical protein
MRDPILEEIERVREQLVKEHGGIDGYIQHIADVDRLRRQKARQKNKKARKQRIKTKR